MNQDKNMFPVKLDCYQPVQVVLVCFRNHMKRIKYEISWSKLDIFHIH